ncbi:MAG: alpha/beta hydrolase [Chloroflexi bacterium]|nr:alpha/beta hydrolase [Chloroflexota bacterium]
MSTIEINGAHIYYQVYGDDHAGRVPILLIHGSTITGELDWAQIAPLLARDYKVYVPDCRGHGKSTNPGGKYSFRQMAADNAAFIRALGYERMHIIGHSNGGNVALVTLLEHPEVTQTAIPQAANAYVTDYLRQREPVVLEPDYYQAHNPGSVQEMIVAHGELHGLDYWRTLLNITMQEIITEWAPKTGLTRPTGMDSLSPSISPARKFGSRMGLGIMSISKSPRNGWQKCWIF